MGKTILKPENNDTSGFDFPSVTKSAGYLHVDHRNSPGLPEDAARKMGYDPALVREGKVFEADTLACCHCPSVFIKRKGADMIGRCTKCDGYVCDACLAAAQDPTYVHRSRQELIEMIRSGKYVFDGGTMSLPILKRKETTDG